MSNTKTRKMLEGLPPGLLAFSFGEIEDELLAFAAVADDFLRPESIRQLKDLQSKLGPIASSTHDTTWGTSVDAPLTTLSSVEFEPNDKKTEVKIYGSLNFKWHIQPLAKLENNPRNRWFALLNSSSRIEIRTADSNLPLCHWDFDLGDANSPGCHFHAKPHWQDFQHAASLVNPIPIPRLPTWLFLPTDCLEFLFGELWQEGWKKRAQQSDPDMQRWAKLSHDRHLRMASCHLNRYKNTRQLSGWMTLKTWKPDAAEFAWLHH